jgi:hypothetical protein
MNPVIAVFTLIGMLVVAIILSSTLTPLLFFLMNIFAKFIAWLLAWVLSHTPAAKYIAKVISKHSENLRAYPDQPTYNGKYRIYIPKPFQRFLYSQMDEKVRSSIPTIENCKNSNNTPLRKNAYDMVNQPVKDKADNSHEDNLTQESASGQPKTNGTSYKII